MKNKKQKPGAGISILGFLLTVLLTFTFLCNGILIGLKTTVLSGSSILDVIENVNAFELIPEMMVSQETASPEEELMVNIVESVFNSDTVKGTAQEILDGIVNNTKVDLSGLEETCIEEMKGWFDESVDNVIEIVEGTTGEISAESLAQNEELLKLQEMYGIELSGVIMEYVEEAHGKTSITVEELDLEGMKESVVAVIDEEISPMLEEMAGEVVVELNQMVNEELIAASQDNELAQTIILVEETLHAITIATFVWIGILIALILLEVLLYKRFKNRAFRNIGIAAIISGLFVVLMGAGVRVAKSLLMELQSQVAEPMEEAVMKFATDNVTTIGNGILIVGAVIVVLAIVCFVVSGKLKRKAVEMVPAVE